MIGRALLHYQITEKLGEGGMGVVYKARDTHLDRFVAIKVLPPEKVSDPSRKARFVQEAKAASTLNHPNIVTIHDISSDAGHDFIAMEYVAGKTLDQLIPRKGMRLNEALKIAVQIADALARAHAAGIIHRDLKPANIMVDAHGQVKVLDFGLAKLTEKGISEDDSTATKAVETGEGTIVGTAAYMSPEQAQGKPVDDRSDIFSFGAVLYEMVTGQRAFPGDSKMSTLSAVLSKDPAPLPPDVPHDLNRIITRCLRKDLARRSQHMDDVQIALQELKEESDSASQSGRAAAPPGRTSSKWLAAFAVVPLVAAGAWFLIQRRGAPALAPRVVSLTSYPGEEGQPAFSPDGRQVAFTWNGEKRENQDIYVRLVGSGAPLRLTTDPAPDRSPVWSPDGTQIAFVRDWGDRAAVYVAPALGGQERKVAGFLPVPSLWITLVPAISWSPDGKWLAVPELQPNGANEICLVPIERGSERKLVSMPASEGRLYYPAFSPNGTALAVAVLTGERSCDVYLYELGAGYEPQGRSRRLTRQGVVVEGIAWAPDGKSLVYAASPGFGSPFCLWRVLPSGDGEPERLDLAGTEVYHPAFSPSGSRLAYSRREGDSDLFRFEAGVPPRSILTSTRYEYDAQFSPDGRQIAFVTERSGRGSELWVAGAEGTNLVRLTEGTGYRVGGARWSPDGRWIVYDAQGPDGHVDVFRIDAAGGQPQCLTPPGSDESLPSWSRDGKWIYFSSNRTSRFEIWRQPATGGKDEQVTSEGGFEAWESWDGKTLYYTKHTSSYGSPLFARPLAGGPERRILNTVYLLSFFVAKDGIYHVVPRGGPLAPGFEIKLLDPITGKDRLLFVSELTPVQGLTVSPDGKTILYSVSTTSNADLAMVENYR